MTCDEYIIVFKHFIRIISTRSNFRLQISLNMNID